MDNCVLISALQADFGERLGDPTAEPVKEVIKPSVYLMWPVVLGCVRGGRTLWVPKVKAIVLEPAGPAEQPSRQAKFLNAVKVYPGIKDNPLSGQTLPL